MSNQENSLSLQYLLICLFLFIYIVYISCIIDCQEVETGDHKNNLNTWINKCFKTDRFSFKIF